MVRPHPVTHSLAINIVGVWVEHRLAVSKHVNLAACKMSQSTLCLKIIARAKDLSPVPMYHVATCRAIHTMLWDSSSWWTGARPVKDRLTPAYHSLDRSVCQAKSYPICGPFSATPDSPRWIPSSTKPPNAMAYRSYSATHPIR